MIDCSDTSIAKYEWKFRIHQRGLKEIRIGIDASNNKYVNESFAGKGWVFGERHYGFDTHGYIYATIGR